MNRGGQGGEDPGPTCWAPGHLESAWVGGAAGVAVPCGFRRLLLRPRALVRAGTRATQSRGPDTSGKDRVTLPTRALRDHRCGTKGCEAIMGLWRNCCLP